ncbi:SGNH/GDSL hydrolase family protein [Mesobacillus foraminis]|jgi:lysophospholipase L1-like esterase|uniref:Lysophospholipase L1-like esterase n=1 Tax=Mesobacillus foraminis TaxID=279826 RepID=A0A4R2B4B4_9BACI|nr:SGNH/GDSL hydrolase family protein [Mesobacillus foraminis]TCN21447.1 lysophospholipase L1-like esterase [Mesobacillus foraminis]
MELNDTFVFIGDSITESGRFEDPEGIGNGYVRLINDYLSINYPALLPQVINKGIGGNHITDLASRWQKDVLDLNPAYVSISIGINDVWRQIDHPWKRLVLPDEFERIYNELILQAKSQTGARLVLMEPTILQENPESEGNRKLQDYADVVRRLAGKWNAIYVPTHQVFISYLKSANHKMLTTDGVHMNSAGSMLMAQTWLRAFFNKIQFDRGAKNGLPG